MSPTLVRVISFTLAIVASHPGIGRTQGKVASWLDESSPASWNQPGLSIPAAPKIQGTVDPRCKEQARPQQLDEDKRVREQGWNLVGPYQGGWEILVIRGTAGYDGMCRPRQYQDFVFVRGAFVGTLSPHAMDSRTDGALGDVYLQSAKRLTAEFHRYVATDPLCCPSKTTNVVFNIASGGSEVRPASASTSAFRQTSAANPESAPSPSSGLAGTSWQLVRFQGSDDTTLTPDDRAKYTLDFAPGGALTARLDCNRGRGAWKSNGPQIEFGSLALTRAQCPQGSLHDQIVKQWGNIRSYVIRDGHLFLALMADGGIYEFEPVLKPKR
jgi:heat shock protein HslJ